MQRNTIIGTGLAFVAGVLLVLWGAGLFGGDADADNGGDPTESDNGAPDEAAPLAPANSATTHAKVVITDDEDDGVPTVTVTAYSATNQKDITSGQTDAAGVVTLALPADGDYALTADPVPQHYREHSDMDDGNPGYCQTSKLVRCVSVTAKGGTLTLLGGSVSIDEVTIDFIDEVKQPRIVVKVVDDNGNLVNETATVKVEPPSSNPNEKPTTHQFKGETITKKLQGGTYRLTLTPPAGWTAESPVATVESKRKIEHTFVVKRATIGDDEEPIGSLGNDLELIGDPDPLLGLFCATTQHQQVPSQNSASGVWVRGEVYGLDGGWIWVEGPSINNGEPVQLPIDDGMFEGPLGINSYGDHPLDTFELQGPDPSAPPIDLLPILEAGPGSIFTVTGDEGPALGDDCFDLGPLSLEMLDPVGGDAPSADVEPTVGDAASGSDADLVERFLTGFVGDHVDGDVDGLLDTLHPLVFEAFGAETCTEYVTGTTGSLVGFELRSVEERAPLELDSPIGPVNFPGAIPFEVDFTLTDDSTLSTGANLAFDDGEPHWLTRCGVD